MLEVVELAELGMRYIVSSWSFKLGVKMGKNRCVGHSVDSNCILLLTRLRHVWYRLGRTPCMYPLMGMRLKHL